MAFDLMKLDLMKLFRDPTAIALVVSNLLTIILAMVYGWGLSTVLWIYWAQSVIIGFFNFFKIILSKGDSAEGVKTNLGLNIFLACFFAVHYGFFHFGYATFLSFMSLFETAKFDFGAILLASGLFFFNHLFSFVQSIVKGELKDNPGTQMMKPYARIIPMHLTIIFGMMLVIFGFPSVVLVSFMLLKTGVDLLMHDSEHKLNSGPVL